MDKKEYMKLLGERVRTRREELGMNQEELAHKVGYKAKQSISKLENGQRSLDSSMAPVLAEALQTTVDYIMGWESGKDALISEIAEALRTKSEESLRYLLSLVKNQPDS